MCDAGVMLNFPALEADRLIEQLKNSSAVSPTARENATQVLALVATVPALSRDEADTFPSTASRAAFGRFSGL